MSKHSKTVAIDGVTYTFRKLDAISALKISRRLLGIVGPSLTLAFLKLKPEDWGSMLTDEGLFEQIFERYCNATDEQIEAIQDLFQSCTADKVDIGADTPVPGSVEQFFTDHFRGRAVHLLKAAWAAAGFNLLGPT